MMKRGGRIDLIQSLLRGATNNQEKK